MASVKEWLKSILWKRLVTRGEFETERQQSQAYRNQQSGTEDQILRLEKVNTEGIERIEQLRQQIEQLGELIGQWGDRIINLEEQHLQLNALVQEISQRVLALENALPTRAEELRQQKEQLGLDVLMTLMQSRQMFAESNFFTRVASSPVRNPPVKEIPFETYLERFRLLYPHLYDTWASVNLGVMADRYKQNPERSCAVDHRPNARLFRGFAAPYLQGRVLDVGCGPLPIPNYLSGYPVEWISGIDPLEPHEPHPFEFVRGFAEFLPWESASFDLVIAATSLDHTLSPQMAFSEIRRVLKPGGFLLVWDWFAPESRPYRPDDQSPVLVDDYHLFHFSEDWFEEMVGESFSIYEKIRLYGFYQYDRFYALQVKG